MKTLGNSAILNLKDKIVTNQDPTNVTDTETKMSKTEQLKAINAEKKVLADKQKTLREELNAGKDERKAARKTMAACRKESTKQKSELRDSIATIYNTFTTGEPHEIEMAADKIDVLAAKVSATMREFATAAASLEDL